MKLHLRKVGEKPVGARNVRPPLKEKLQSDPSPKKGKPQMKGVGLLICPTEGGGSPTQAEKKRKASPFQTGGGGDSSLRKRGMPYLRGHFDGGVKFGGGLRGDGNGELKG